MKVVEIFTPRVEKLKNFLSKKELQNILILSDANIFYLTGFYGNKSGSLLLIMDDSWYLLVSLIYLEQAKKSVQIKNLNIICCKNDKFIKLTEILEDYKIRSIGIEGNNINFSDFCRLKKMLSGQGKRLIDCSGIVEKSRSVKDQSEISNIKNACKITDRVFKSIVRTGADAVNKLSEAELSLKIEELLVKSKSEGKSFDTVVAYGKNSSMPHHFPQNIKSKDGIILMDFGCRYNNYCSDMTRTVFIGDRKKCNKFKKIYDIVLKAQIAAIENCREGITCSQLDGKARKFVDSKGFGDNFGHGLGHGVGLEVHEEPKINMESKTVLRQNMVITIEPGIYIEGFGGIRIEDMVIVGKNKCEVLYSSTKKFIVLD